MECFLIYQGHWKNDTNTDEQAIGFARVKWPSVSLLARSLSQNYAACSHLFLFCRAENIIFGNCSVQCMQNICGQHTW